jgi:hypothetical protein
LQIFGASAGIENAQTRIFDMNRYTVSFRYTKEGEKKAGPVQRYVLYANSPTEARKLLKQYANYPNLEVLALRQT